MAKPRKKRKSRSKDPSGIPKGAYLKPNGNYVVEKTAIYGTGKRARAYTISFECFPPGRINLELLAKALIELALIEIREEERQKTCK